MAGEKLTYATSVLLTLEPGVWYYRVRGVTLPWHGPRDVVVGAGRPQGREAHLRGGRQEVRTLVWPRSGRFRISREQHPLPRMLLLRQSSLALSPDSKLALSLADDADAITLARFRAHDLRVETRGRI